MVDGEPTLIEPCRLDGASHAPLFRFLGKVAFRSYLDCETGKVGVGGRKVGFLVLTGASCVFSLFCQSVTEWYCILSHSTHWSLNFLPELQSGEMGKDSAMNYSGGVCPTIPYCVRTLADWSDRIRLWGNNLTM